MGRMKSRLEERLNKIRKERIDERKQELEDDKDKNIKMLEDGQKRKLNAMQKNQLKALEESSELIEKPQVVRVAPKVERKVETVEEVKRGRANDKLNIQTNSQSVGSVPVD